MLLPRKSNLAIAQAAQAAVDAMTAQGLPEEAARTMLSYVVEGQSVMLATLNMFGVIAVSATAPIHWLRMEPAGDRADHPGQPAGKRPARQVVPVGRAPVHVGFPDDDRQRLAEHAAAALGVARREPVHDGVPADQVGVRVRGLHLAGVDLVDGDDAAIVQAHSPGLRLVGA